jgi:hypothetical protein
VPSQKPRAPSAFVAMRQGGGSKIADGGPPVPTIVFHGDRDTTVHPNNGDRIVEQSAKAAGLKAKVTSGRVPLDHVHNVNRSTSRFAVFSTTTASRILDPSSLNTDTVAFAGPWRSYRRCHCSATTPPAGRR